MVDRKADEYKVINLADIVFDGVNVRKKETDLTDLAQSIKEYRVLEPIIVRPKNGMYEIVAGSRRVKASRLIGENTIPAIIRDLTDEEAELISYTENAQRNDLDIEDEGSYLEKLHKRFGKDDSKVAEYISRGGVKHRSDYVENRLNDYWSLQRYKAISARKAREPLGESRDLPKAEDLSPQQHALLESTIRTVKQTERWSDAEADKKYVELFRELAANDVDVDMTRKILDEFKKYPEESVNKIASVSKSVVDYSGKIPSATMREAEETAKQVGISVDKFVSESLKREVEAQRERVNALSKTPETVRRAIETGKIDFEPVKRIVDMGVEINEEKAEQLIEEYSIRKKEEEKGRDAQAKIDAQVIQGKLTPTVYEHKSSSDERHLKIFENLYETVRWIWARDLLAINNQEMRVKASGLLTMSKEHLNQVESEVHKLEVK